MAKYINLKKSRYPVDFHDAKASFEREFFTNVLKKYHGNVSFAAEEIHMSRRNLHLKITGLGIDVERLRD